jgi:hypothetical protein
MRFWKILSILSQFRGILNMRNRWNLPLIPSHFSKSIRISRICCAFSSVDNSLDKEGAVIEEIDESEDVKNVGIQFFWVLEVI